MLGALSGGLGVTCATDRGTELYGFSFHLCCVTLGTLFALSGPFLPTQEK